MYHAKICHIVYILIVSASSDSSQPLPLSQSFSPEAASPDTAGSPPLMGIRDMAFSQEKGNGKEDIERSFG